MTVSRNSLGAYLALAVVAGLTLTSASSVAHDLYASVIKKGRASEKSELFVVRVAAFGIGAVAIALAIPAQRLNIAFLVALAFAVAASANLPAILYNMFWKRFNTRGATWSIYGGLVAAVGLVFFSPVVSGEVTSLFPNSDWAWFPLSNPGIVSIPLGFLLGRRQLLLDARRLLSDRPVAIADVAGGEQHDERAPDRDLLRFRQAGAQVFLAQIRDDHSAILPSGTWRKADCRGKRRQSPSENR